MLGHNTLPRDVVNIPVHRQEDVRIEESTVYINEYGLRHTGEGTHGNLTVHFGQRQYTCKEWPKSTAQNKGF